MAAILFSKWPPLWQLFRNKMLKQIRGHWYKPTYPFFFSDINYIDKKIDQIILEQVPCLRNFMKKWQPFWTKWPPFLVSTKKHHVQQNVHITVVLSSKFCTDIIFSLGNMKLFVSFFHITAVKRCHSQIVLNTNCTPTFMDS